MTALVLAALGAVAAAAAAPPPIVDGVGIDEKLGARVPANIVLRDADDHAVELGAWLASGTTPVVLTLAYYRCPMLCGLVLNGLATTMHGTSRQLGKDYRALTVSFDPRDAWQEAARTRDRVLELAGRPDARSAWLFATGEPEDVKRLADTVGFHYVWDDRSEQFAHPAVVLVLMPDGRVARYLYGFDQPPRQLELALADAASGKSRSLFDRVLLTCFHWDPAKRRYGLFVVGFLRGGAALLLLSLGGLLYYLFRLERRQRRSSSHG